MLYCKQSPAADQLPLDIYQRQARLADQNRRQGPEGLRIPLLGLFGEVGSLLTEPKRQEREKVTLAKFEDSVIEEFGDVLWYLSNLASRHRISLSALAQARSVGEEYRIAGTTNPSLTFSQLQRRLSRTKTRGWRTFKQADYFALGGAVGGLMSAYAAGEQWELNRDDFAFHLARTFRLLVRAAGNANVSLGFAATNNLAKIESRWPAKGKKSHPLFDEEEDKYEQLPRRIEMYFEEKKINGKTYVIQRCKDINIGDRLTDNKVKEDDYRFHDVFHLAYAAILGWSPVTRALFRVKRKSKPLLDENQDGARAILIEEGIATWIFNHGIDNHHFRYTKKLDYALLKAVRHLVNGYEVDACPLWQWELAILRGFAVFRDFRRHRKGWVIADLNRRTITFRQTAPGKS